MKINTSSPENNIAFQAKQQSVQGFDSPNPDTTQSSSKLPINQLLAENTPGELVLQNKQQSAPADGTFLPDITQTATKLIISQSLSENIPGNLALQNKQQTNQLNSASPFDISAPATKLSVDQSITVLLKELSSVVQKRESLIKTLPADLKIAVSTIIQQTLVANDKLTLGLTNLFNAQKNTADKLRNLAEVIINAQIIKDDFPLVKQPSFLQEIHQYLSPLIKENDPQIIKLLEDNNFTAIDKYIISRETTSQGQLSKNLNNSFPLQQKTELSEIIATILKDVPENPPQLIQKNAANKLRNLALTFQNTYGAKGDIPQAEVKLLFQAIEEYLTPLTQNILNSAQESESNQFPLLSKYMTLKDNALQPQLIKDINVSFHPEQNVNLKEIITTVLKNIPEKLAQLAQKHNLPALTTLWASVKLHSALPWIELTNEQATKSKEILLKLVSSFQAPVTNEEFLPLPTHKTFSLAFPIYFENNPHPYPTYIHVYHDAQNTNEQQSQQQPETWIRVCLSTENIGIVDAVFRLYHNNFVSIRMGFTENNAADVFAEYLPEIESVFSDSSLNLTDISVK